MGAFSFAANAIVKISQPLQIDPVVEEHNMERATGSFRPLPPRRVSHSFADAELGYAISSRLFLGGVCSFGQVSVCLWAAVVSHAEVGTRLRFGARLDSVGVRFFAYPAGGGRHDVVSEALAGLLV